MFSVVKMMKEQGNQFDWSQIAIDIPSLPCFDQSKIEEFEETIDGVDLGSLLREGYSVVSYTYSGNQAGLYFVVKVTGDSPSVEFGEDDSPTFNDCEPVTFDAQSPITPIRALAGTFSSSGVRVRRFIEGFSLDVTGADRVILYDDGDGIFYVGVYWEQQVG